MSPKLRAGCGLAAAAVAAALIASPAAAQTEQTVYVYGAIKDKAQVQKEDPADRAMRTLPVVYEDRAPAKTVKTGHPVSRPSAS